MGTVVPFALQGMLDYIDKTDNCFTCRADIDLGAYYFEWPSQQGNHIVLQGLCSSYATGCLQPAVYILHAIVRCKSI